MRVLVGADVIDHRRGVLGRQVGVERPPARLARQIYEQRHRSQRDQDDGAERVIRVLKYHRGRARGRKRKRLETQLTYFRNQRPRMRYAEYVRNGLPIASGVMGAACKTLVTQRLKQSGMAWTQAGGQPILTLRSLIQSDRWQSAWALLRTDFCKAVTMCEPQATSPPAVRPERSYVQHSAKIFDHCHYAALPLAV